jgi:glycerophosphocholine phosphodiesterase GPCPD1
MGSSFDCTQTDCIIPTENTISSFREAANHGAEFVEFDVLLTSDLVPVVFHDFDICVELSESGDNHSVVYPVKVKDLTLSELRHTKLYHEHALNGHGSAELERFSINEGSDRHHLERRSFPTLEEVFKEVPSRLGFNIEVKYPSPAVADRGFPYFSYNLLADVLIKAVYRLHDGKRRVFFSTFDTDLCTMLRLKQPRFPVFYLTCTEAHTWRYLDVRMQSLSAALAYTKLQNLPGICTYSNMVIDNPNLVRAIQDLGLIMLTFGDKNNKKKNIALQQETGVDGVICDIWKLH